jgi:hypothetical protein
MIIFPFITASAQSDSASKKSTYFFSLHAGGLLSKTGDGTFLSASTIHGVRKQTVAFGVGLGYNAYLQWRTFPVFASISYDFASLSHSAFFMQINAGSSRAWVPDTDQSEFVYNPERGLYVHPVIGYRVRANQFRLYVTAGYQHQNLQYEQTWKNWIWGPPSGKTTIDRTIQRVSLQIGIGVN